VSSADQANAQAAQRRRVVGHCTTERISGRLARVFYLRTRTPETTGRDRRNERQSVRRPSHHAVTAQHDRALKEAARERRHQLRARSNPAPRFTEQRDVVRVAAERRRIAAHPAQRRLLILQTERARSGQARMTEETEDPQSEVDGDHDQVALGCHASRMITNPRAVEGRRLHRGCPNSARPKLTAAASIDETAITPRVQRDTV
jgi:hypothetical protein